MHKFNTLAITVSILASAPAGASDFMNRTWVGGTAGYGFQSLSTEVVGNTSKSGTLMNLRLFGEYRSERWGAFGLGLGGQQTSQDGSTTARYQELKVRSLLLDISYLYPVYDQSVWVGALVSNQLGAGTHFNLNSLTSMQDLLSVGPQVRFNYRSESGSLDYVAGAQFLYGFTSPGQTVISVPIYVGILVRLGDEPGAAPVERKAEPTPEPTTEAPKVQVNLDAKLVTFDVDKTTLKPASVEFLEKVSKVLVEQAGNWSFIAISGHTDGTGGAAHNLVLSEGRAKAVMDEFVRNGVPAERLSAKGFGSKKMIAGHPRNSEVHRRVELSFDGVNDAGTLQGAMDALRNN